MRGFGQSCHWPSRTHNSGRAAPYPLEECSSPATQARGRYQALASHLWLECGATLLLHSLPCAVCSTVCVQSTFLLDHLYELMHPPAGQPRPTVFYFNYGANVFCRLGGAQAPPGGNAPPLTLADITFAPFTTADPTPFEHELRDAAAYLLIDLGGGDDAAPGKILPSCDAQIVAVGSPSACHSKKVRDWLEKVAALERRYLPVLSLEDLEECRRLTCPTAEEEAADRALPADHPRALLPGEKYRGNTVLKVFHRRYERYGGIPRTLFDSKATTLTTRLKEALNKCSLEELVRKSSDGTLDALHEFSTMVLHYRVFDSKPLTADERKAVWLAQAQKRGEIDDPAESAAALSAPRLETLPFCLLERSVQFSGEWMADRVYEQFKAGRSERTLQQDVKDFLQNCVNHPALMALHDAFFAAYARAIMRQLHLPLTTPPADLLDGSRLDPETRQLFATHGPRKVGRRRNMLLRCKVWAEASLADTPSALCVLFCL